MSGRKINMNFHKLKFEFVRKRNGKPAAKCLICETVICNTAAARLQMHRNICKPLFTTLEGLEEETVGSATFRDAFENPFNANKKESAKTSISEEETSAPLSIMCVEPILIEPSVKKKRLTSKGDPRIISVERAIESENKKDEFDIIGKSVASKLRRIADLDFRQFICAEKSINDVLYSTLLKQLASKETPTSTSDQKFHYSHMETLSAHSIFDKTLDSSIDDGNINDSLTIKEEAKYYN